MSEMSFMRHERHGWAAPDVNLEVDFNKEVVLPLREKAVKPEDMLAAHAVTKERVLEDAADMVRFKQKPDYSRERSAQAVALEAALYRLFDDGEFGDGVKFVQKTSEFDDVTRGVDFYIDIGEGDKPVFLGIDVTTHTDKKILLEKVERNVNAAMRGRTAAVRYFYDALHEEDDPLKGYSLEQEMPRVILGLTAEKTVGLERELLAGASEPGKELVPLFLEQMLAQLELLENIAPARSKAQKIFSRAAARVQEMINEKGLERVALKQASSDDLLANPNRLLGEQQ